MLAGTGPQYANMVAVFVLGVLGLALLIAAAALTVAPLCLREGRGVWQPGDWALTLFFAAIGLGFIMVEMAVIQRTGIMLGHPVYGLQVTLFSLLLGSGLGSLLSSRLPGPQYARARFLLLGAVVATGAVAAAAAPLASGLRAAPQAWRIGCVALVVLAAGLFMGTPFPTGLEVARASGREQLLPWLWGVNGVCSVLGAFLATVGGIFIGARITGLSGAGFYAIAYLAISWYTRSHARDRPLRASGRRAR